MEKIFLKSTSKEISLKGSTKEGHTDSFAYDYYGDDAKRKLGGLYVVGNVKQDAATNTDSDGAPDVAYVINLVASLAKREYYSKPELSPREAFSATLKKINDVVEEFFKNKSLKVNVGVFAVAGGEIMISKLGKFKIILGRPASSEKESRTVDILNNIDLFNKEAAEEREFSNIISGKVMAGDKLFAFFPNRMMTAREKAIKTDLLKLDADQFMEKVNLIKETKPDFECGALYLTLSEHRELATPKKSKPAVLPKTEVQVNLAKAELKNDPPKEIRNSEVNAETEQQEESEPEVPRIISTEFSLARKVNPILSSASIAINMLKNLYNQNINLKKKLVALSFLAGVFIVGVFVVKTFIVIDPEQRKLNAVISQTQKNLKLAQNKIDQNDFIGARQILSGSLSDVYAAGSGNEKTQKAAEEIYQILDGIDKAAEVPPTLLETMPEEVMKEIPLLADKRGGVAADVYEGNLYILKSDTITKVSDINDAKSKKEETTWLKSASLVSESVTIAVDGNVYTMNKSGTLATYYKGEKVSEVNTFIISNEGDVLLTSKNSDKLYLVNKKLARVYELEKKSGSLLQTFKIGSSEPFVDAYLYGDNSILVTTKDNRIWQVK